jgi:hypothetical protein
MSKAVLEIYEALKLAGVPDDKAQAAAKAVAELSQEDILSRIENGLIEIKGEIKLIKCIVSSLLCKKFSRKSMVVPRFNLLKPP